MHGSQMKKRKNSIRVWRNQQLAKQKGKCYYCKCKMDTTTLVTGEIMREDHMTIDQKIHLSKGGQNVNSNKVLACRNCNSYKGNLTLEEFVSSRVELN